MALFNYVANKNPSSTTQSILNDIQSDITPGSLQKNLLLQCLHQHILRSVQPCTDKPTAIINGDNDNGCDNTLQTSSDNHIVLIMPYKGHVWEIDSLQSDPVYLGLEGDDWTEVAQQRLESWTSAAYHTKVHNDIHPIVLDKTTFLR
ncbi:hypothetical protein BC939DRAFT_218928 [Gamsiella multidivaricata]|uniref:uncharacterized protein n=1 Tax=Gamsiella multidivaricata TaxID=101098 RepID=UPI002220D2E9|nr:uncharacterized protein BC939DRAFT_35227 [Gamsiella multidivaricata]XP_051410445.1 uncharacterized protein BC939DRAFT_218928 [Gamsiella multidivaricata]KAI7816626.1 hypothetical protein BC939DRAFT_35227 [Gamsiella multidivaricata]KAI7820863.1 hypothetical protein BC939DRAFT_218928 [Gamsiella multidivaricata]